MADLPKAKPMPGQDPANDPANDRANDRTNNRTSALVVGGMVVLAAIGVGTIFSETIAAALSPSSSPPVTTPVSQTHPPAVTASPDAGRP
jgi:hypothetical protein